ncbi:MAG: hypothetical protein EBS94_17340, partial [Proteobacteria bacterium]|nr:hypothetical protein [Pseudomonadota bacterium]
LSYAQTTTVPANDTAAGALTYTTAKSVRSKGASVTGSIAAPSATFTGSQTTTVLTVTAVTSGTLVVGQQLTLPGSPVITALGTGLGGIGTYTLSNSQTVASAQFNATAPAAVAAFTGTISTTTLTVTSVSSGTLAVGQVITGSGVTAGTVITALGTGTGRTGTYTITPSQTVSTPTLMNASATYLSVSDVTSGTLAVGQVLSRNSVTDTSIIALGTGTGGTGTYLLDKNQSVGSTSITASADYIVVKAVTTEARGLASPPALSLTGALTKDMTPVSAYSVTACPCTNYYYASRQYRRCQVGIVYREDRQRDIRATRYDPDRHLGRQRQPVVRRPDDLRVRRPARHHHHRIRARHEWRRRELHRQPVADGRDDQ